MEHALKARRRSRTDRVNQHEQTHAVPHKDFSDLYEKMSGKGESAGEAHLKAWIAAAAQKNAL